MVREDEDEDDLGTPSSLSRITRDEDSRELDGEAEVHRGKILTPGGDFAKVVVRTGVLVYCNCDSKSTS